MKKGLTELVIIIDKSGSMGGLEKDVIGGYNRLIEDQKKLEGEARVTTVLFSDKFRLVNDAVDINKVNKLTESDYVTSGCTALLDAIGTTISSIKAKQDAMTIEEIPEHTIVSIMTDGEENASREYSYENIKKLIERLKEAGWEFIFQAANIDAFSESGKLGINLADTTEFEANKEGLHKMFTNGSAKISLMRTKVKNKK